MAVTRSTSVLALSIGTLVLVAVRTTSSSEVAKALHEASCPKQSEVNETYGYDNFKLHVLGTDLRAEFQHDRNPVLTASLGLSLPPELGQPTSCSSENQVCLQWGSAARVEITPANEGTCHDVDWAVKGLTSAMDCIDIGDGFWYGGGEEKIQHFPLRKDNQRILVPYLPGDMLQDSVKYFGGVTEPYWLNSKGVVVWVPEGIPLFFSWNNGNNGQMCLASKYEYPYVNSDPEFLHLSYKVCTKSDAREAHLWSVTNLLGVPEGIPDERMMRAPVWSSWAQYKADINESVILQFAEDIRSHGFNDSQLEIDDNWESCYGDALFSQETKFPDPKGMVGKIKELGFRVTLWIHPFINFDCSSFMEVAGFPKHYVIKDTIGRDPDSGGSDFGTLSGQLPGMMYWWQGAFAGYVDFTNAEAVDWWRSRLDRLRTEVGIDSFKFDAGEVNWFPSSYVLEVEDKALWPGIFSTKYVEGVSYFGSMIEVRVGLRSQHNPVFVRMLDKDSTWDYDNGLKTMVTTLLQMSMTGYPFVLPDMIGGNGYSHDPLHESEPPTKELFVRWMQVNVFMPAMQFSFAPWLYDDKTVAYARTMTTLHYQYSNLIKQLAEEAASGGAPINRPVWWIDPTDTTAQSIDSEFLLGNKVLVAPILDEGATSRDIYLPKGSWRDEADPDHPVLEGPRWIYEYKADLYTLPYFTAQ